MLSSTPISATPISGSAVTGLNSEVLTLQSKLNLSITLIVKIVW